MLTDTDRPTPTSGLGLTPSVNTADPKQYAAQQGLLLFLLIARRVPSSRATFERSMTCMIRGASAEAWPDDIAHVVNK